MTGRRAILLNPAAAHLASTLQLLMQLNQAPYRAVLEARLALEPGPPPRLTGGGPRTA